MWLLVDPLARRIAGIGAAFAAFLAAFWAIRQSGKDDLRREQVEASNERLRNVLEGDSRERDRIARDGVFGPDPHRRD